MTEKRFNIEFDGHQYFLVIDEYNERCLARLDTRIDALAWLEIYKMLSDENEQLKDALNQRTEQCDTYYKENEQLKKIIEDNVDFNTIFSDRDLNDICNEMGYELSEKEIKLQRLEKENEQLKQRNTNQYNQLNKLWGLIQAKDWETLTAMDNQMKEDEERLQREWKCYE